MFRYGYRGPVEFLPIVFRLVCVFTNRIIAQANYSTQQLEELLLIAREEHPSYIDREYSEDLDGLLDTIDVSGRIRTLITTEIDEARRWNASLGRNGRQRDQQNDEQDTIEYSQARFNEFPNEI